MSYKHLSSKQASEKRSSNFYHVVMIDKVDSQIDGFLSRAETFPEVDEYRKEWEAWRKLNRFKDTFYMAGHLWEEVGKDSSESDDEDSDGEEAVGEQAEKPESTEGAGEEAGDSEEAGSNDDSDSQEASLEAADSDDYFANLGGNMMEE